MARARSFANVTACRAVSNPAWCRIFREISCFSPLNIGTLFRCCVLRQGTLPSHASLDSGSNEYLVGQRWQCVRLVPVAEMAASAVCSKKGVEMVQEWTGPVTRGNMCEAHRALYVRYIRTHHYFIIIYHDHEKCANTHFVSGEIHYNAVAFTVGERSCTTNKSVSHITNKKHSLGGTPFQYRYPLYRMWIN